MQLKAPLIVHISTSFNRSGSIHKIYAKMRALTGHGYRVALICGREFDPSPEWDLSGIPVFPVPSLVKSISPQRDAGAFLSIVRLLRFLRPEGVHTHFAKAGILGRWAAHCCRVPYILHTVHGPTFAPTLPSAQRWAYHLLEKSTGKITSHFVFVGEELRQSYVRKGVCSDSNSDIVRSGRPDGEIESLGAVSPSELRKIRCRLTGDGDAFTVVCIGRVVPSKQQDHAIRVLHALKAAGVDARLVLVGEAFLEEEKRHIHRLRRLAEDLCLSDRIRFAGFREDALRLMAAADAVLHTSSYEGLPNVLVEAALASTPVVTYDVFGAAEVVRDGETGYIVPQGDRRAAAQRLIALAADRDMARRMGEAAFRSVSGEYRESEMVRNKLRVYDHIFRKRQPPSTGMTAFG